MLRILALSLLFLQTGSVKPSAPAAHVPAADLEAAWKDAIAQKRIDIPVLTSEAGAHNVEVAIAHVAAPILPVTHDKVTEMYYVLEGAGTHVSGGTMTNPRRNETPGGTVGAAGPTMTGDSIQGGLARRVGKGDYIIIPAGTPHAWTELEGGRPVTYVDIRIDPDRVLQPLGKRRLK